MNVRELKRMAFASERTPRSMFFIIMGNPIPLARPRFSKDGHVWDSQKPQKLVVGLDLIKQLGSLPKFEDALSVDFKFYFPLPTRLSIEHEAKLKGSPHKKRCDLDNCIKMYLDCSIGVLFEDDCLVSTINASKMYDDGKSPRTEMIITELF